MRRAARFGLIASLLLSLALPALAQNPGQPNREQPGGRSDAAAGERRERGQGSGEARLPPESVTVHSVVLPDRTLAFTARAGALTLTDPQGAPQAEYGFVSYTLDGAAPGSRPVSFVVNGGPGASSAYLHLLAIG